jgi:hypothetical protein
MLYKKGIYLHLYNLLVVVINLSILELFEIGKTETNISYFFLSVNNTIYNYLIDNTD